MSVRACGPAEGMSRRCQEEGCLCMMRYSAHSCGCSSPASITGCTGPTGPASQHAVHYLGTAPCGRRTLMLAHRYLEAPLRDLWGERGHCVCASHPR